MKNTAKYYPGSPALQLLAQLLYGVGVTGGYIDNVSASKIGLILQYGERLDFWKNYRRDTLTALVEDELVIVDQDETRYGQAITPTDAGRALYLKVMNR